jgi:hypothetical protein
VNGNILKFAGPLTPGSYVPRKLENLDVDAHSTTSLIAPRAIFATNGTDTPPGFGDAWADPRGCFLSGKLASPVWELLGWRGQVIPEGTVFTSGPDESVGGTPPFNVAFIDGTVGWRRQIEGHVSSPNWPTFATFAARYLNDSRPSVAAGQTFSLDDGTANGVGTVAATDADATDVLGSWQIKGGDGASLFRVDRASGQVSIANPFGIDYWNREHYTLDVMVGDGKLPSHDAEITIHIPYRINLCHREYTFHHGRLKVEYQTLQVPKYIVPLYLLLGDSIGGCSG